jgi:hypothetical protein
MELKNEFDYNFSLNVDEILSDSKINFKFKYITAECVKLNGIIHSIFIMAHKKKPYAGNSLLKDLQWFSDDTKLVVNVINDYNVEFSKFISELHPNVKDISDVSFGKCVWRIKKQKK